MAHPQPGIFALGTRSHYHLEFDRRPGVAAVEVVRALQGLREPAVTVGGANIVVGFGAGLWRELAAEGSWPRDLAPFAAPPGVEVPATQHDLWVWVHGTGDDVVLDVARETVRRLAPAASVALDQWGFVYHDSRDLTGFVDGTANPPVEEAASVVCLGDGEPGAGGTFVITSRWIHDLDRFAALKPEDQERVFGRTKADSIELDDDVMPPDAHIARVELEGEDGEERAIYRRSVPFGTVTEQGLFFVGFSPDLARLDEMLARMYGATGDGVRDRLLDISRPVTGAYYFVPGLVDLNRLLASGAESAPD